MKKGLFSEKPSKRSLIFTMCISLTAVFATAVSTYAWFQSSASANVTTTSSETTITVAQPDAIKFYRFNGNGTPGGSGYVGYSKSDASFGNTTNIVDTANSKYSINGGTSYVYYNTNTWSTAWTEIDITDSSDVNAAFNFSKMRPGCYYSFAIKTELSSTKLKLTYSWNGANDVIGSANSIKRYVATVSGNVVTQTNRPLNVLMAVNGYGAASTSTGSNAASYINGTFNVTTSTDKIVYDDAVGGNAASYYLLGSAGAGVTTSTNNYVYFTIFMGFSNKADALMYRGNNGANSYYERGNSAGSYGPLDGLKSTLSSIEVL